MQKIRIKKYLIIHKIKNELHFLISPFIGIKMQDSPIIHDIIEILKEPKEYDLVIDILEKKLEVERKYVELFLERLLDSGILEYINHDITLKEYDRYDRQLHFFDTYLRVRNRNDLIKTQNSLSNTHVVILGVGGIGNYASVALASAGIGQITLIDGDIIELSNLNRQFLFSENDIGKIKIDVVKERISSYNSKVVVNNVVKQIESEKDFNQIFNEIGKIDFILVSADSPYNLMDWVDKYCENIAVPFIPCGYMGNQGVIGPLIDKTTKRYNEICPIPNYINVQSNTIQTWNTKYFNPPSLGCTNGILSNIASLEIIKYVTGICTPLTLGKRVVIDLETFVLKEI